MSFLERFPGILSYTSMASFTVMAAFAYEHLSDHVHGSGERPIPNLTTTPTDIYADGKRISILPVDDEEVSKLLIQSCDPKSRVLIEQIFTTKRDGAWYSTEVKTHDYPDQKDKMCQNGSVSSDDFSATPSQETGPADWARQPEIAPPARLLS